MGTKNNPGKFDCYENAEPDEPRFALLGRDPLAGLLVDLWVALRRHSWSRCARILGVLISVAIEESKLPRDGEKELEAERCAESMMDWIYKKRRKG